jgi:hypothetical protein
MRNITASSLAASLGSLLFGIGVTCADEGMWTFDNFPSAEVKTRYGADITPQWLDRTRRAVVRLEGGCTGSFASPDGLVLTNHHCVVECIARLATAERDTQALGFRARSRAEEARCPAEAVSVLERMEDVTPVIAAAVGDAQGATANERRKSRLTELEQACEASYQSAGRKPHSCEAVTLYGGGQYFIYHYRRYTDVRLVLAPESTVAFFGGDIDNFEFPRWNLDFSLLRAYEDGKPARTPDYLRWRSAGAAAGEPVFVAGHPGSTERLSTVAQLNFERAVSQGHWLLRGAELRGRLLQYSSQGTDQARIAQESLFGLENVFKVRRNLQSVLLDEQFMAARVAAEQALRARVAGDPRLAGDATAWQEIEDALSSYGRFWYRHNFIEVGAGLQGDFADTAGFIVRAALERERPNSSRRRDYTDPALPRLKQVALAPLPDHRDLEILRLTFSLEKMVEYLGLDDPAVRAALGRESARSVATRVIRGTRIQEVAFREQLWAGGRAAVEASDDPLIKLVLALEPEADRLYRREQDEVEAPLSSAAERIARARFAVQGTGTYPDATFTLRLSYGKVAGWREGDREVSPFTTLDGLYARTTGQPPFELPSTWLAARDRLEPTTPINFTTDNDIVGGNSGSPMLDARGRLVGLIFDGNRHSIGGSYWFDAARNRSIGVHPAAILLALREVYDAPELLRELRVE